MKEGGEGIHLQSSIIVQPKDHTSHAVVAPDMEIISGATNQEELSLTLSSQKKKATHSNMASPQNCPQRL